MDGRQLVLTIIPGVASPFRLHGLFVITEGKGALANARMIVITGVCNN
jgi:hypothetical protein